MCRQPDARSTPLPREHTCTPKASAKRNHKQNESTACVGGARTQAATRSAKVPSNIEIKQNTRVQLNEQPTTDGQSSRLCGKTLVRNMCNPQVIEHRLQELRHPHRQRQQVPSARRHMFPARLPQSVPWAGKGPDLSKLQSIQLSNLRTSAPSLAPRNGRRQPRLAAPAAEQHLSGKQQEA